MKMITYCVKGIKIVFYHNMLWFYDNSEAKSVLNKATICLLKIGKNIDDIVDFIDKKEFWIVKKMRMFFYNSFCRPT
jgi:hypothetical protein